MLKAGLVELNLELVSIYNLQTGRDLMDRHNTSPHGQTLILLIGPKRTFFRLSQPHRFIY